MQRSPEGWLSIFKARKERNEIVMTVPGMTMSLQSPKGICFYLLETWTVNTHARIKKLRKVAELFPQRHGRERSWHGLFQMSRELGRRAATRSNIPRQRIKKPLFRTEICSSLVAQRTAVGMFHSGASRSAPFAMSLCVPGRCCPQVDSVGGVNLAQSPGFASITGWPTIGMWSLPEYRHNSIMASTVNPKSLYI